MRPYPGATPAWCWEALNQAWAALGSADGLQAHRSWWVAKQVVARAVSEGRNLRLQLVNGITAPVARSAVAIVREAGWLTNESRQADTRGGPPLTDMGH